MTNLISTLLGLIVRGGGGGGGGGSQIANFWEKTPQLHSIIIRE